MTIACRLRRKTVLPGFALSLGITVAWLSLVILIPLSTLFLKVAHLGWPAFVQVVTDPEAVAAYRLSFSLSAAAAGINVIFGALIAWVLVRCPFPGRRIVDGLVDLPFALPTAVAGITLTTVYAPNGLLGAVLARHGIQAAYAPLGIVIALVFVGMPFVVRTVQPVLEDFDSEAEEAAASLGASRLQVVRRVLLPALVPSLLTGFALAFARSLGEYGSVVFIAGNIPMKTEIAPFLIMSKLEQFDYPGASAIAVVLLLLSFVALLIINGLQRWSGRRSGRL